MYLSYYQLREKPFALPPDPSFLYPSKKHRMGLTMLEYGLHNQEGFVVISGGIGTGKTTLLQTITGQLNQRHITFGMITNAHEDFGDLLQWVMMAFGQEYADRSKTELYRGFLDFVMAEHSPPHGAHHR